MTDSDILRLPAAAELLDLSEATVTRHARNGTIPARKAGKFWFFSKTELEAFIRRGQAPKGRSVADQMPRPHKSDLRERMAEIERGGSVVNLEARR